MPTASKVKLTPKRQLINKLTEHIDWYTWRLRHTYIHPWERTCLIKERTEMRRARKAVSERATKKRVASARALLWR